MYHPTKKLAQNITLNQEKKAQTLSPFELKNKLINEAETASKKKHIRCLNAGRVNPNFFNGPARLALWKLTEFAVHISQPYKNDGAVRFRPLPDPTKIKALYDNFNKYFENDRTEGVVFF